jgi:hypothetical protein
VALALELFADDGLGGGCAFAGVADDPDGFGLDDAAAVDVAHLEGAVRAVGVAEPEGAVVRVLEDGDDGPNPQL